LVAVGGLVATASVLLTAILGVSRMAFSMARREDLPYALSKLHSKYHTPYYTIVGTGVLMAVLVLFVDLTQVVAISTFALVFTYCVTNVAAYKLGNGRIRWQILPLVALATCIMLLGFLLFASPQAWITGVAFLAAGSIYYIALRRWRKKVLASETNKPSTNPDVGLTDAHKSRLI
jgi:Amino acid transporters